MVCAENAAGAFRGKLLQRIGIFRALQPLVSDIAHGSAVCKGAGCGKKRLFRLQTFRSNKLQCIFLVLLFLRNAAGKLRIKGGKQLRNLHNSLQIIDRDSIP